MAGATESHATVHATFQRRGDILVGRFDEGPGYRIVRPRGSLDWLLFYTRHGCGLLRSGRHLVPAEAGSLAAYAPAAAQDYRTDPGTGHWSFDWCHLQLGDRMRAWMPAPVAPGLYLHRCRGRRRAVARAFAAAVAAADGSVRGEALARNAVERGLLLCADEPLRGDERIALALHRIHTHLDRPVSVADLADAAGLSPGRFAHLFRAETGAAPMQYVERCRMALAARLLTRTSWPIGRIAAACGYPDPFYFSARFRRHHATPPSTFRRRQGASGKPDAPNEGDRL